MNEFVEQCRRQWRRLRVPMAVADEMATELEADLDDAAVDGMSRQEAVGDDPRAFAEAWAAERGFTRRRSVLRQAVVPAAVVTAAALSSVITVFVTGSNSDRERVSPRAGRTVFIPVPPDNRVRAVMVSPPVNPTPARVYTGGP